MKYIVLDTETTNSIEEPLVYDLGFAVIDENAKVIECCSFIIKEIFFDNELMNTAYYKDKMPKYIEQIKNGEREISTFYNALKRFKEIVKRYKIERVFAHNAIFDYKSLTNTIRYLTGSKYRYFFPYSVKVCDTLKMSRKVFNTADYKNYCTSNNYLTKRNQVRLTAEIIYRYITNNNDFIEEHTGLEDVLIEKEIFKYCININKYYGELFEDTSAK